MLMRVEKGEVEIEERSGRTDRVNLWERKALTLGKRREMLSLFYQKERII